MQGRTRNQSTVNSEKRSWFNMLVGIILLLFLSGGYWYISTSGLFETLCDCDSLHEFVVQAGIFGPLIIIGVMTLAIVMSPIPSAPIALAAGMAYGHTWGTIYIIIGAELGAIIAFLVARLVGYEVLHRWFGDRLNMGLLGSQHSLMLIVFVGRLLPFISFDLLSYAAGVTSLAFWRFAVATLAGVTPISFLLAHFGHELGSADMTKMTTTALFLGGVVLLPFGVKWAISRWKKTD